uniref:Uracil phosphoribosyltransferase n=1 Tax=Pleonosporium borreri TaxID=2575635 RepID=A0A4D6WX35_9FLOR|nr:hypothetical protein [Pleonosporium borreri]
MQLNIYIISHPIIKLLSTSLLCSNINKIVKFNNYKLCSLLLIYEASRKSIAIQPIYLKKFQSLTELYLINKYQKYYLFTNVIENYMILTDIKLIIPDIFILDIKQNNSIKLNQHIIKNTKYNNKIIIFEKILSTSKILEIIDNLTINYKIPIENINIISIACYNYVLNIIGKQYSNLKIYTTKIIQ